MVKANCEDSYFRVFDGITSMNTASYMAQTVAIFLNLKMIQETSDISYSNWWYDPDKSLYN